MATSLAAKPREKLEKPRVTLPEVALESLNLADELYTLYLRTKRLLEDADAPLEEGDDPVPLNQKAQTVNSIVAILGRITTLRTDIYNAERLKALESALLDTLKAFPTLSEAFIEAYEKALEKC